MSPVLVHDTEQEIKDLQAELAAIERKLEEGRMEVDLLQSKQDRSQEGADKQFRFQDLTTEHQEDMESRVQAELQKIEMLESKFKVLDDKLRDAQDYLRDAEAAFDEIAEEHHAVRSEIKRLKVRQIRHYECLSIAQDLHSMQSTEARLHLAQSRTRKNEKEEMQDQLGRYMQDKEMKEARLKKLEMEMQSFTAGPSASSDGPEPPRGSTGRRGQVYTGRIYLEIPYCDKDEAKALGAQWEPRRKKWYAQSQDIRRKLIRWPEVEPEDPVR